MTSIVTIRTYGTPSEALVAKSLLEAHGLFVLIPDLFHAANAWHLVTALQGVRLCTLDHEAADARALLAVESETTAAGRWPAIGDIALAAGIYLFTGIPHPIQRR